MVVIKFYEILKVSLKCLIENKVRTLLSSLSIIIGICSIIVAVGLVQSIGVNISKQLEESGLDSLILQLSGYYKLSYYEIAEYLSKQTNYVVGLTPKKYYYTEVISSDGKKQRCEIQLLKPNAYLLESLQLIDGRFLCRIDETHLNKVAIVYSNDLHKLFDNTLNLFQKKLFICGEEFEIVGVVSKTNKMVSLTIGSSSSSIGIIVPYDVGESLFNLENSPQLVYIKCKKSEYNSIVKDLLQKFLKSKGVPDEEINILDGRELLQSITFVSYLLSALLGGVATVSLVVSGIGIMNIILISVSERIKEIGIRKAVGAKNSDIRLQFLTESFLISTIGLVVGILVGLVIVYGILPNILKVDAYISPTWILISIFICYFVGIVAGWAPAEKAAKLEPSLAIRYE